MKKLIKKIIDWFKIWESVGDETPNVSYNVQEYTTSNYNVLGEKINTKTRYFICKTITWDDGYDVVVFEYGLYIEKGKQLDNCQLVKWINRIQSTNITYFDNKEDAEKTLNDILTNPNNYIIK